MTTQDFENARNILSHLTWGGETIFFNHQAITAIKLYDGDVEHTDFVELDSADFDLGVTTAWVSVDEDEEDFTLITEKELAFLRTQI